MNYFAWFIIAIVDFTELRDAASLQRKRTADVLRNRQSDTMTRLSTRPHSALDLPTSGRERSPSPVRPRSTTPTRAQTKPTHSKTTPTKAQTTPIRSPGAKPRPVTPSRSVSFSTDSLTGASTKTKSRSASKSMSRRSTRDLQKRSTSTQ